MMERVGSGSSTVTWLATATMGGSSAIIPTVLTIRPWGIRFHVDDSFKRSAIVSPAQNLVVGDKQPYGSPPFWGSSLWWEAACMDPAVVRSSSFPTYEGVEPKRHLGQAVISFNDGHSEARKSTMINPPANPADSSAKALINSQYWDPLQRGGNQ